MLYNYAARVAQVV